MDILFGTYRCPDHEPERFGIHEPSPATYVGHLVEPVLPRWEGTRTRSGGKMEISAETAIFKGQHSPR